MTLDNLLRLLQTDFHFLRPEWFWALLPAVLLFMLARRRQSRGSSWEQSIDASLLPFLLALPTRTASRRLLNLLLVGWVLAIVALAGPVWEKTPQPVHEREDALVIILDLSRSMYAIDVKPNRLVAARRKLQDMLALRQEGVTALIAYAGDAHTVAPLTDDARTISTLIPAIAPEIMPAPGSQLAPALTLAVQLFADAGVTSGRILLLTDEIRDVAESQAIARQHRTNFPISVMSVGSSDGAPIDGSLLLRDGGYLKDAQGNLVIPRVDLAAIRAFAAVAGGRYSPMTLTDEDLAYLLAADSIAMDAAYQQSERNFDAWFEQGPWLILLLLPLAALAFRRGWLWSLPLLLLLPQPQAEASVWDDLWTSRDQQAQQALQAGDAATAAELFKDESWQAAARYRSEDYAGAAEHYAQQQTADARYNLGNTLARLGKLEDAIDAYEEALQANPNDADATFNRDLVKKLLAQQEQQEQDQSDKDDNKNPQEQSDDQQDKKPGDQADDQQRGEPQSSDAQADEQGQDQGQENAAENNPQQDGEQQEAQAKEPSDTEADPMDAEERQALENWLRKVPDDPGGLLRRKFEMQYTERLKQGRSNNNGNQSNW